MGAPSFSGEVGGAPFDSHEYTVCFQPIQPVWGWGGGGGDVNLISRGRRLWPINAI